MFRMGIQVSANTNAGEVPKGVWFDSWIGSRLPGYRVAFGYRAK